MTNIFSKNATKIGGGNENNVDTEDMYKLIDLFFNQNNIMYAQAYNSFDKFIDDDLKNFLLGNNSTFYEKQTKDQTYVYKFVYSDIAIKPPMNDSEDTLITPYDARTKGLTYSIKLVATVTQIQDIININTGEVASKVIGKPEYEWPIARIPVMVNSRYCANTLNKVLSKYECKYDPGSYFIVGGSEKASEKTLINTERMIENKPLVFTKRDANTVLYSVQVNSRSYTNDVKQTVTIRMAKNGSMNILIHIFSQEIPIFILIRALGIESDYDIINYVSLDKNDIDMINIINLSLENCKDDNGVKILTQEQAITYLVTKVKVSKRVRYNETDKDIKNQEKKLYLKHLLNYNFLPHIDNNAINKGYYVCYMIHRLLQCYLKRIEIDDRDSLVNKRIDLPGTLMFELFKQAYKKMLNECTRFFKKRNTNDDDPFNIINQIKPNTIEQAVKTGLLTGSWDKKKGVAQMLQRLTFKQTVSLLRRVNSPATDASTNKLTSPRHLHPTQVGFLCVTGDTMIMLPNKEYKMIKYLNFNDIVLSVNRDTLQIENTRFTNYFTKMPLSLLKISTTAGYSIKVTPDHPFLVEGNTWVIAKNLEVGTQVYISENNNIVLTPIRQIIDIEPELVYDFETIGENHSFIANNFIVSNCHVETPEGHQVGLVKNLAIGSNITIMLPSQLSILKGMVRDHMLDIQDIPQHTLKKYTRVFINGEPMGLTLKPREIYNHFKKLKLTNAIDPYTGIVHEIKNEIECKELYIYCDGGRCYRPILRVENNKILYTKEMAAMISVDATNPNKTMINDWTDFMIKNPGVIEYIDQHEQYNSMIGMFPNDVELMRLRMQNSINLVSAMDIDNLVIINRYDDTQYVKYTHCEIHPSLHMGIVVNDIPFCNSNQGPRNMFQFSQAKQAMAIYLTSYRHRLDISYILYHPYKPLVYCRMNKYTGTDQLPSGENAVVALACYSGFNQEDSMIFNQTSIDRGIFRSANLSKLITEIQKNQSTSQDDIFVKPDPESVIGMKQASYDKLNELGYVPEETEVVKGDIILGKISPIQPIGGESNSKKFKDSSEAYKYIIPGVVDKVWTKIFTSEGYEIRMVRIRSERIPHIGDKLCCYSPDHEVLTMDGWVPIDKLTVNHEVACLMGDGDTMEYKKPTAIQSFDYEGSMYVVDSTKVSLRVTPNHRMYVGTSSKSKFRIEEARDIYGTVVTYKKDVANYKYDVAKRPRELLYDVKVGDKLCNYFAFYDDDGKELKRVDLSSWLTFFGIWIAEGCVTTTFGGECEIRIATNKQRVKDELARICEGLGFTLDASTPKKMKNIDKTDIENRIRKHQDKEDDTDFHSWRIKNTVLTKYLSTYSVKAVNKYLPNWVWYLKQNDCRTLMDGMIKGDGQYQTNKKKDGTISTLKRYDTSSIKLRDDFQKLCLHAGFCADSQIKEIAGTKHTIKTKNGKILETPLIVTNTVDSHRLSVVEVQTKPKVNKNVKQESQPNGTVEFKFEGKTTKVEVRNNQSDKYEDYKGKVYCCTVPTDLGVIYVRRSNEDKRRATIKAVWCGNSRMGQKGIIGLTLPQASMPFTKDGICPDLIINPNCIPSRMTLGQLFECLIAKVSAIRGHETDGTPFQEIDLEKVKDVLESLGYNRNGYEYLYNGMTGRKMKSMIFIGPTYYQRLKHMVSDKIHARARGPKTVLTRQAPEGRSRDGGLRFGEMERDCIIAHGCAKFLKERMLETADAYSTYVCLKCGLLAQRKIAIGNENYPTKNDTYFCKACKNTTHIAKIRIPYAFKLLLQEMMAMNIAPRIRIRQSRYI
jgi:DNA-directed RNA polymerase beta subunit/intein/homing endonuclease